MVTEPQILALRREAGSIRVEMRIPANLGYLRGHFPDTPIVPGVVLLKWALELARKEFVLPAMFRRLSAVKFMRVMPLERDVVLNLHCAQGEVAFEYLDAGRSCVQGRALFGAS